MKALSVQQPWAWAIFNGKPLENRDWSTSYRGPLLIHASKTFDYDGMAWILFSREKLGLSLADFPQQFEDFERGGFIGIVDVVDCVQKHESPWFFGPRGWVFANPMRTEFVPFRGMPGLFPVPDEIVRRLMP